MKVHFWIMLFPIIVFINRQKQHINWIMQSLKLAVKLLFTFVRYHLETMYSKQVLFSRSWSWRWLDQGCRWKDSIRRRLRKTTRICQIRTASYLCYWLAPGSWFIQYCQNHVSFFDMHTFLNILGISIYFLHSLELRNTMEWAKKVYILKG